MHSDPQMLVQRLLPRELFKGTVFVTGGGSGINLGVAKNFAALGANVAICGRTQAKLDAAAVELRALGAQVCPMTADVRDFAALDAALARSGEELGSVDVLVCGAAGNFLVPAEKLSANLQAAKSLTFSMPKADTRVLPPALARPARRPT